MSIVEEMIELAELVNRRIELPMVSELYLPKRSTQPSAATDQSSSEYRDEFGVLFLDDDAVGTGSSNTASAFYASLQGTLSGLWRQFPTGQLTDLQQPLKLLDLIYRFRQDDLADKALALGAFNAMSQYVMKRAGLLPLAESNSTGAAKPNKGEQIGMVGYFCPLIDKLIAKGVEVLVLEQQPERVLLRPGVSLTQNPADLESCRIVLCTAATLVNDSIDDILAHCTQAESFNLLGPSGSGLPDLLFDRGVESVGGVYFPDTSALRTTVLAQASWGKAGVKYQLTSNDYPGIEELLVQL